MLSKGEAEAKERARAKKIKRRWKDSKQS